MTTDHKTFDKFISWAMNHVFDGLITGGTKEMKARLQMIVVIALSDGKNKKWEKA